MKVVCDISIKAPINKVFGLFTDLDSIEKNVKGIKSIEVLDGPAKMAVGTKWKETRMMFGKEASETMAVTDLKSNKSYTVKAASKGMEYTSYYTFTEEGEDIWVKLEFVGKPISWAAKLFTPIGWLFKGSMKKTFLNDMQELKVAAENI